MRLNDEANLEDLSFVVGSNVCVLHADLSKSSLDMAVTLETRATHNLFVQE